MNASGALAGKTLTRICAGLYGTCSLDTAGTAYCWGRGSGEPGPSDVPVTLRAQAPGGVTAVPGYTTATVSWTAPAFLNTGTLTGYTATAAPGGATCATTKATACTITGLAGGTAYTITVVAHTTVGDSGTSMPVAVTPAGVGAISAGSSSCAIESGRAWCWGSNDDGQLGDGSLADSGAPVAVDTSGVLAGQTLTQISISDDDFTCALDAVGAAYCWGRNNDGQLGDASTASSDAPVAVDTSGALAGRTLTQITAGNGHTCALASTGMAYCWGDNNDGQLGIGQPRGSSTIPGPCTPPARWPARPSPGSPPAGTTPARWTPPEPPTAGAATTMASSATPAPPAPMSGGHRYQRRTRRPDPDPDHRGRGPHLCAGYRRSRLLLGPQQRWPARRREHRQHITGGRRYQRRARRPDPAAGHGRVLRHLRAGRRWPAYCWGDNDSGQLGDQATSNSSQPVAVNTSGVLAGQILTQISSAVHHTCALDTAGAVFCWGYNGDGDLGDNTTTTSDTPVLAGPQAPTGVTAVANGGTAAVSWNIPVSLDGGLLVGYTATAAPGGASCTTTGATTCTITSLVGGTTYNITVVARTTTGDSGATRLPPSPPRPDRRRRRDQTPRSICGEGDRLYRCPSQIVHVALSFRECRTVPASRRRA